MRTLNVAERKIVAGGAGPAPIPFKQKDTTTKDTTTYESKNGNITVDITCPPALSFGFNLGLATTGKVVDLQTGATFSYPSQCTITTSDADKHTVAICRPGEKCEVINLDTNKRSEMPAEDGDSGLAQLAAVEGVDIASLENGGASDGLGTNGGFGDGGGGGGSGHPEGGDRNLQEDEADTGVA